MKSLHGGNIYEAAKKAGCNPDDILDFSSNVSPLMPPIDNLYNLLSNNLKRLSTFPDIEDARLISIVRGRYNLEDCDMLIGNGTTEFIFDLPIAFPERKLLIITPTYSDYERAASVAKAKVEFIGPFFPLYESASIEADRVMSAIKDKINSSHKNIVFVCNPNNPTGLFIDPQKLFELIGYYNETLWVIDESYAPFLGDNKNTSLLFYPIADNLIILRSFSKIYGIPGIRLGMAIGGKKAISFLRAVKRPWSCSAISILLGEYFMTLDDMDNIAEGIRRHIMREKKRLLSSLNDIGFLRAHTLAASTKGLTKNAESHAGSEDNSSGHCLSSYERYLPFLLFEVMPPFTGRGIYERLLRKGILVRNCDSFRGMEGLQFIRISPRDREKNNRLIDALYNLNAEI